MISAIIRPDLLYHSFNSLSKGQYSNLFIAAGFYSRSFAGGTSLPVKNSY